MLVNKMNVFISISLLFFAVLGSSFTGSHSADVKAQQVIAERILDLKSDLSTDVGGRGTVYMGWSLREVRNVKHKLASTLAEDISIHSSQAGLAGSLMIVTGLIPSPASPFLLYYGSYLALGSTVGHIGSYTISAINDVDLEKLQWNLETIVRNYEEMRLADLIMLEVEELSGTAESLRNGDRVLTEKEMQDMYRRLYELELLIERMKMRKEWTLLDKLDLCKALFEILDFFPNKGIDPDTWHMIQKITSGSIRGNEVMILTTLRNAFSRELDLIANGIIEYGATQTKALQSMGLFKTALVGVTSIYDIYSEAKNIEGKLEQRNEKERFVRRLDSLIGEVERYCRSSPYCTLY